MTVTDGSAASPRRSSTAIAASSVCSSASRRSGATRCARRPASSDSRSTRIHRDSSAPMAACAIRTRSTMPSTSSPATPCIFRRSSAFRCGRSTAKWCARTSRASEPLRRALATHAVSAAVIAPSAVTASLGSSSICRVVRRSDTRGSRSAPPARSPPARVSSGRTG